MGSPPGDRDLAGQVVGGPVVHGLGPEVAMDANVVQEDVQGGGNRYPLDGRLPVLVGGNEARTGRHCQVRPLSQQPLEIRHAVLSPRRHRSRAASYNLLYCTLALFSTARRSRHERSQPLRTTHCPSRTIHGQGINVGLLGPCAETGIGYSQHP
jgi:hypothetical protein